MELSDDSGRTYSPAGGYGFRDAGASLGADVSAFDAAGLLEGKSEVTLRLTIPEISAVRVGAEEPTPVTESRGDTTVAKASKAGDQVVRVAGPWSFSFTIPVIQGRVAEVNQTLVAGGIPVTLERVVVTPTEARAYLPFPAGNGIAAGYWQPIARLTVGDWDSARGEQGPQTGWLTNDGAHACSFSSALYEKHGDWTLAVEELVGLDPQISTDQTRLAGPWVFHFVVP